MPIQTFGIPFNARQDTISAPETGIMPDGSVVAVERRDGLTPGPPGYDVELYTPDGELISRTVALVDDGNGNRIHDIAVRPDGSIVALVVSPFGPKTVALFSAEGTLLAPVVQTSNGSSFLNYLDVAPGGSFTVISDTAGSTGFNGDTLLSRFDANGIQIGSTAIYHESTPAADQFLAGQHDTMADGTLVIARTQQVRFTPFNAANGVDVDLVRGGTVTSIPVHRPSYGLDGDTNPPSDQSFNEASLRTAPQAVVLATGGFAVLYSVNLGNNVGSVADPSLFIRFFDDNGGSGTAPVEIQTSANSIEIQAVPLAGGRVAVVWHERETGTGHIAFVSRDAGGSVSVEQAQFGTLRWVFDGTAITSVDAAADGSVVITYLNNEDPLDFVTQRVYQVVDGVPSLLTGTNAADEIAGTEAADMIDAEGGDDQASGLGGDDAIYGGIGNDTLDGGEGIDKLFGRAGDDYIVGGAGNDMLFGGDGIDTLFGGDGDDYIQTDGGASSVAVGGAGNDTVYGGAGNDYFVGDDGNDVMVGLGGQDSLYGGAGDDYLVAGPGTPEGLGSVLDGGAGANSLWGGSGNDYMVGGEGADLIVGAAGSDYQFGLAGNDTLYGGQGTDYIYTNAGDDFVWTDDVGAPQSQDFVYAGGGTGIDTIADFTVGPDGDVLVVAAAATGISSFTQVQAVTTQAGVYSVVALGADQVYLYNVSAFQLTADNFLFL